MPTITRGSDPMGDRYKFDFKLCTYAKGWAQLDTRQDASYYGNWLNPTTRELLSYCEGDMTHTQCADNAEFIATVSECIEWHREREYFIGIDAGGFDSEMAEAFKRLGLGEFLH